MKRFTLKKVATVAAFLAMLLVMMVANRRSWLLQEKLRDLKDSHGLVTQDIGRDKGDRWEMIPIGGRTADDTFLLRVRNYEEYCMRLHYYDGVSMKYKSETHDFVANETVVRFYPETIQSNGVVEVHDVTWPIDNRTYIEFDRVEEDDWYFNHGGEVTGLVQDGFHAGFVIQVPESEDGYWVFRRLMTGKDVRAACEEAAIRYVWLTLEER